VKLGVVVVSITAVLAAGCESARRTEPIAYPRLDAEATAGEVVFARHCHMCHPHGEAGVGPALDDKPLPDAAIELQIRTGVVGAGTMPPFPPDVVSDEEIELILAYLKAIRSI
jgi:mono/diheme cytochrome c family protein